MVAQAYPTLDGIAPSWADIKTSFTVYGGSLLDTMDYSAINTGSTVEVGEKIGASGGRVMETTTGSAKHEASATFYKSGLRKLLRALMEKAPSRGNQRLVSLVHFDILIQHTPPGEPDIYVRKVKGCRLLGITANHAEGNDADQVELSLHTKEVVDIIDGVEVVLL